MPKKSTPKKEKKSCGRKPFKLTEQQIQEAEKLCRLSCTDDELAAYFEVCKKTIQRYKKTNPDFSELIERGRNYGRLSLRRKQMEQALKGNTTMLIWLGKQYLDQRDKQEVEGGSDSIAEALNNLAQSLPS